MHKTNFSCFTKKQDDDLAETQRQILENARINKEVWQLQLILKKKNQRLGITTKI